MMLCDFYSRRIRTRTKIRTKVKVMMTRNKREKNWVVGELYLLNRYVRGALFKKKRAELWGTSSQLMRNVLPLTAFNIGLRIF